MSDSVSIVITTFNDAKNLQATLASVREQLGIESPEVEVVVSDGGSTDATEAVVAAYSDIITTIDSRPDSGIYDGMNLGAALAKGEWLHFLNAGDTFAGPNCLLEWSSAIDSAPRETVWAVSRARHLHAHTFRPSLIANIPHTWWRHAFGLQSHCHQATWFRRSAFEAIGGYRIDRGLAGDFDLILRFGLISRPLEIPLPLIDYLGGGVSEVGSATIPGLMHAVRVDRLNLGAWTSAIDLAIARLVGWSVSARGRIGVARRRLTASRSLKRAHARRYPR
jgi:glycosyltransferase involved in cell wall biosynthesis